MNKMIFIFLCMVFAHIIADYNLQGCLAELKQKEWWRKQMNEKLEDTIYKNDWAMALFMHSFAWTFCVMIPVIAIGMWKHMLVVLALIVVNTGIHFVVDDMKANRHKINLIEDQNFHLLQILCIFIVSVVVMKYYSF